MDSVSCDHFYHCCTKTSSQLIYTISFCMHTNQEIQNKIDMDLKKYSDFVHGLLHTICIFVTHNIVCTCGVD